MLVFFIHGVATRTVQYADDLKVLLKQEFTTRGEPIPQFHSSFWGDVLSDVGKIWNGIHQDLQILKTEEPSVDIEVGYWNCPKTAELIASNILGNSEQLSGNSSLLDLVISRWQKVRGITKDAMQLSRRTLMDETLVELKLKNGSGMLRFCVNHLKIYHVYVFDSKGVCKYVGYVGWIEAEQLKQEIEFIKNKYLQ
ncbi:hypothetical protein [Microseira sp. BLCC-F43]|jgi:hypothetical protein|uniref:hypothetical protein n=1 Tax=Microseira sp. BLCC-F43 TaxID=3153602 RepID=UPI0035B7C3A4